MMRGWTAVIVFSALAVVMMVGVNVRMWRRMKAATAAAKAEAKRAELDAIELDLDQSPRSAGVTSNATG